MENLDYETLLATTRNKTAEDKNVSTKFQCVKRSEISTITSEIRALCNYADPAHTFTNLFKTKTSVLIISLLS